MRSRSIWGLSPKQSIELECARRGEPGVVMGCIELLTRTEGEGSTDIRPATGRSWTTPAATTIHRPMPAAGLALFHEALPKLLELATVLRLAGLFLDLLRELLPLVALSEVLGPLEQ